MDEEADWHPPLTVDEGPPSRELSLEAALEAGARIACLQEPPVDMPTRPYKTELSRDGIRGEKVPSTSIIDLTISNQALGLLDSWEIETDGLTTSDHLVIWASWECPEDIEDSPQEATITGWQIGALTEDKKALEAAISTLGELMSAQPSLTDDCSLRDVEREAKWIEQSLTDVLRQYAKPIRLCARSKRWWGPHTIEARGYTRRLVRLITPESLVRIATVRPEKRTMPLSGGLKRQCWEAFLQGTDKGVLTEQKRCWAALRYTKPNTNGTTPALIDPVSKRVIAAKFSEKEILFREQAFPQGPESSAEIELLEPGDAYKLANKTAVRDALFSQGIEKAPGTDLLNFRAIRLLWCLDQGRVIALVRQCLRLGIHPAAWKTAKGILLRKPGKGIYMVAKAYRVISLLKCLGKVVEKPVAGLITDYAEAQGLFYEGQFGARRQRSAVAAVVCLIGEIENAWGNGKLGACLFMDIKGAFDYVVSIEQAYRGSPGHGMET
uniref:Putative RNA-directed DNA polymerase from transposon X-element n=1 Tax=Talaromyces marneffei PM1 TaxID=1077442 RepID=A0A093VF66_TALMA